MALHPVEIAKELRQYPFFVGFPEDLLVQVCTLVDVVEFPQGANILTEGEANSSLYFIRKGRAEVLLVGEVVAILLAASRYSKENRDKSDMELFVESTRSAFSILSELKKDKRGFWWDLYVTKFNDLVETKNYEAFCYYISKSLNADDVKKWIADNPTKMDDLKAWMKK